MSLPPGPRGTPLDLWRWLYRPFAFLDDCAKTFGDAFSLCPIGLPPTVVFSHPDAIAELFALSPQAAHAGAFNVVLRPFLGERSLFVMDGPEHRRARRLVMPPFHRERLEAMGSTMAELADEAVDRWPTGRAFPIDAPFREVSLEIVLRAIFGADSPCLAALLANVTELTDRAAWAPLMFDAMQVDWGRRSPWGRFRLCMQEFDALLRGEIRDRRRTGSASNDILGLLLDARDEVGEPMEEAELIDQIRTLIVAGHETTATALTWAVHLLLDHPAAHQRVQREVDDVRSAGPLDATRVAQLPWLQAVVQETLRLYPGIPMVGRILAQPATVGGYELDAGTAVVGSIYLAHRRAFAYPSPEQFDPDRFVKQPPSRTEFLPFGGGARRCIAAAFAMREMQVVLATLLARRQVRRGPGPAARVVRRGVVIVPSGGVPVVLAPRRERASLRALEATA